jgi:hypothetical protein
LTLTGNVWAEGVPFRMLIALWPEKLQVWSRGISHISQKREIWGTLGCG